MNPDFIRQIPSYSAFKKLENLELERFIFPKDNGKYMLDLTEANRQILVSAGIKNENMDISDICTCCNCEDLHSHRATGGKRGNLALIIQIV